MGKRKALKKLKAAAIRALRTFIQVFCGGLTVGLPIHEIDWKTCLSVAAVATLYSFGMAYIGKLPEDDPEDE